MDLKIDNQYMLKTFEDLVKVPSPVSYYDEINPVMEGYAKEFGVPFFYDRKRTIYFDVEGEDNSRTVLVGAHLDTLGLMVSHINSDGTLLTRRLGGLNFSSLEGESMTVHTRDGKKYTGLYVCKSHSVHVFDDAHTLERTEQNMLLSLDEDVHTAEDVRALGICEGDVVSFDPHFEYTETGYIKSRFVDDKACVAAVFGALKFLKDNNLKPKYRTLLAFPHYEEINHGGAYVPEEVEEFVAVDIGLVGPELQGTERKVSICAKDAFSPYDRTLTTKLVNLAKEAGCDFVTDVFVHYGTDGNAAIRSGNNLAAAAFGMGCYSSHSRERTHILGVENTAKLVAAYMLSK